LRIFSQYITDQLAEPKVSIDRTDGSTDKREGKPRRKADDLAIWSEPLKMGQSELGISWPAGSRMYPTCFCRCRAGYAKHTIEIRTQRACTRTEPGTDPIGPWHVGT
jgi:hypothetical protein